MYTQVAHEFADLHDRSGRMLAKGVIRDVVEWEDARAYFHARLERRLAIDKLAAEAGADHTDVEKHLQGAAEEAGVDWCKDVDVSNWINTQAETVKEEVASLGREASIVEAMKSLAGLDEEALSTVIENLKSR